MIPRHEYASDASVHLSLSVSPIDSDSYNAADDDDDLHHNKEGQECVTAGDPSWVARPRNAFIIFRCEYARVHSRHAKGEPEASTGKSLSKRAAEAWHQLSSEEKSHFNALADKERREHARLYPNYRFRPTKRPLPKRTPPARLVSLTNLLEQCSDNGTETNGSRQEITPLVSAIVRDVTDDKAHETPPSLFLPQSCEVLSDIESCPSSPPDLPFHHSKITGVWSSPSTSPVIPCPSHVGMIHPFLSSPEFDPGSSSNLSYAAPECILPPSPQFCGAANISTLQNSPLSLTPSPSSLANWDGKAPDHLESCTTDIYNQSPELTPVHLSGYLGRKYSDEEISSPSCFVTYTDPRISQAECWYDPTSVTAPIAVESQSTSMSLSTSTFDELMFHIR